MKSMELTDQEARLIRLIREVDKVNPAGADSYTSAEYMSILLRMMEGIVPHAAAAYEKFRKESAKDKVVDLAYYRAPLYEDGKHTKKRG